MRIPIATRHTELHPKRHYEFNVQKLCVTHSITHTLSTSLIRSIFDISFVRKLRTLISSLLLKCFVDYFAWLGEALCETKLFCVKSVSTQERRTLCRFIRHLMFLGCIDMLMRKLSILASIKIMLFKCNADTLSCDTRQLDTDNINDICWRRCLLCLYDAALIATGSALDAGMFNKPLASNKNSKDSYEVLLAHFFTLRSFPWHSLLANQTRSVLMLPLVCMTPRVYVHD